MLAHSEKVGRSRGWRKLGGCDLATLRRGIGLRRGHTEVVEQKGGGAGVHQRGAAGGKRCECRAGLDSWCGWDDGTSPVFILRTLIVLMGHAGADMRQSTRPSLGWMFPSLTRSLL